uniref:Ig-like domain-containing protein n=1 Tax=Falco tinnunculus TaxID=100819 RepID=A0A8C4U008_FALTI
DPPCQGWGLGGLLSTPALCVPPPHSAQDPSPGLAAPSQPLTIPTAVRPPEPEGLPPCGAPAPRHSGPPSQSQRAPQPRLPGRVSGAHTIQVISGCDILEDGSVRGYYQDAYDGRDFLTLDVNTMTFTASDEASQITKRKWEQDASVTVPWKNYLENTCPEWLRKYVSYGRAALARKEPPTVRVSRMATPGTLTLYCRAYGFYPRLITVTWVKDGEIMDQETEWGSIVPNSDGTYHTSASIRIHPGEEDKYQCHVDHASLTKTEIYVWGEPAGLGHAQRWAEGCAGGGQGPGGLRGAGGATRVKKKGYNTQVPGEYRRQVRL